MSTRVDTVVMENAHWTPTTPSGGNFTWADYAVFIGMLFVSSGIGLYFAYKNRKNHSNKEFLTANRSLGMFPVAMSLLASFQSSVTILGYPAEMFYRGTQFWMVILSSLMASVIAAELFLPVFYKIGFTSINQYLEERFESTRVRLAVSFSFLLCTVPYMGVVLYGPSLALETVTGLSVTASILIIGGICTLYTSLGGIKAVVWTDVVQVFLMFAGLLVVMIRGFYLVGGIGNAFEIASRDNRINFFNFKIDPTSTTTIWNTVIGMGVMWSGNYATSQTEVQRYCNVTTERRAKFSLYVNFLGVALLISFACLCGIALYGNYADCDPLKSGQITKTDQLMPFFVMNELKHLPGMAGLFVSCVFSASLSTMSSGFNALATVTYDDFIVRTSWTKGLPENRVQLLCKAIALAYGLAAIAMAFVASNIDSILQAAISIAGALVGPMFGLFLLGILVPFANSFGVLCGLFSGEIFGVWVLVGSLMYPKSPEMLHTRIDQCPAFNMTTTTTTPVSVLLNPTMQFQDSSENEEEEFGLMKLYHIAFLLVPVFGCMISATVGIICSIMSGGHRRSNKVRPQYLSRHAWSLWPASWMPPKLSHQMEPNNNNITGNGGAEFDGYGTVPSNGKSSSTKSQKYNFSNVQLQGYHVKSELDDTFQNGNTTQNNNKNQKKFGFKNGSTEKIPTSNDSSDSALCTVNVISSSNGNSMLSRTISSDSSHSSTSSSSSLTRTASTLSNLNGNNKVSQPPQPPPPPPTSSQPPSSDHTQNRRKNLKILSKQNAIEFDDDYDVTSGMTLTSTEAAVSSDEITIKVPNHPHNHTQSSNSNDAPIS